MPYLENKSLDCIIKYGEIFKEDIKNTIIDICEGIQEFHSHCISHLNIKPSNIFITDKNHYLLSDYNDHEIYNGILQYTKNDLIYLSPEMKSRKEIFYSSDMWSFGCVMYYIITKSEINIINPNYNRIMKEEYVEIIKKLLNKNQYKRMSCKEVKCELNNIINNEIEEYNKDFITLFIINKYLIIPKDFIYQKIINNRIILVYIINNFITFPSKEYLFLLINLYWNCKKVKSNIIHQFNLLRNDDRNDILYIISKGIKENNRIDYYNNKLSISGSYILLQNLYRLEGIKELNMASIYIILYIYIYRNGIKRSRNGIFLSYCFNIIIIKEFEFIS